MMSSWVRWRPKSPFSRLFINRLFRRKSKKTSKLRATGFCAGNSVHKGPVTRKMFPFDDVIMFVHIRSWRIVTTLHEFNCGFGIISCRSIHIRQSYFTGDIANTCSGKPLNRGEYSFYIKAALLMTERFTTITRYYLKHSGKWEQSCLWVNIIEIQSTWYGLTRLAMDPSKTRSTYTRVGLELIRAVSSVLAWVASTLIQIWKIKPQISDMEFV